MKEVSGLKIKIIYKAQDAVVSLKNVPFDITKQDYIIKAFRELGNDSVVADIFKLKERTNKTIKFDITGSDTMLKPFFEKHYSGLSWNELLSKYASKPESKKDKEADTTKEMVEQVKEFFTQEKIKFEDMKFKKSAIKGDDDNIVVSGISNAGIIVMSKLGRRINSIVENYGYKYITSDRSGNNLLMNVSKTKKRDKK